MGFVVLHNDVADRRELSCGGGAQDIDKTFESICRQIARELRPDGPFLWQVKSSLQQQHDQLLVTVDLLSSLQRKAAEDELRGHNVSYLLRLLHT